ELGFEATTSAWPWSHASSEWFADDDRSGGREGRQRCVAARGAVRRRAGRATAGVVFSIRALGRRRPGEGASRGSEPGWWPSRSGKLCEEQKLSARWDLPPSRGTFSNSSSPKEWTAPG